MSLRTASYRNHGFVGFDQAVIVDVETTGLNPKTDRIVSIACLRGSIAEFATIGTTYLDRFDARVNPEIPIPPEATRVHGIRDQDVAAEEPFADIANQLRNFIGSLPLIGHNVSYDKAFLSEEFRRAGERSLYRNKSYCTMRRLREHFGYSTDSWYNMSLSEAAERFGLTRRAAVHSAFEDALLALQLAGGLYQLDNGIPAPGGMPPERATTATRISDAASRKRRRTIAVVAIALVVALLLLLAS